MLFQAAVLGDARDFLWDVAFPRFQAARLTGPFLEALVPHILSGRLTVLPPEVVQVMNGSIVHCSFIFSNFLFLIQAFN